MNGLAEELANRLGVKDDMVATTVSLRQTGSMRGEGATRWSRFSARQTIATDRCSFDWRARSGPLGLVRISDVLDRGEGRLAAHFLGLPVVNQAPSTLLTRGETMRYLAELAWNPLAILRNGALDWRSITNGLLVSSGDAKVELWLDGEGRIDTVFAPDRPRAIHGGFVPTPWQGRFTDYRRHMGLWLPFAGEVGWQIENRYTPAWQGIIQAWRFSA